MKKMLVVLMVIAMALPAISFSPSLPENSYSIFKTHFMGDEGVSYLPEALPNPSEVSRLRL